MQKINDRVDLDALYIYRWKNWIGPYVRLGAETNLFPDVSKFRQTPEFIEFCRRIDRPDPLLNNRESFQIAPPAGLIRLRESVGLNLRLFRALFAEINVRTGVGGRHRLTRDFFNEAENQENNRVVFNEAESDNQLGIETTVLAVGRITRWVVVNLEFDTLLPFTDIREALLDLEGSVALKLTRFLSLRWVVRFIRDRAIQPDDRLENELLLRFSVALL